MRKDPDQSDRALLDEFLAGNSEAAETVLMRYEGLLRAYLTRRLRHGDLVEEALQETFCRLLQNASRLARHPRLEGWLFTVARNVSVDMLRRQRRVAATFVRMGEAGVEHGMPDGGLLPPEAELRRRELSRLILSALRDLPEAERQVFLLRTQFQVSFREIAVRQDAPINTVLSRMHRALKKIRARLVAEGWDDGGERGSRRRPGRKGGTR
jgi:RNA polymerase sigma-70 factor (ECF subfamily)